MINNYLGQFNSLNELKSYNKQLKVAEYRELVKRFNEKASMELNSMMCDLAKVLIKQFGLTPEEIEAIELETI